jgi:hypothetical protein
MLLLRIIKEIQKSNIKKNEEIINIKLIKIRMHCYYKKIIKKYNLIIN